MSEAKLRTVLDGGRYFEGPRWHHERLWFVDCLERTLLSISLSGSCERHATLSDDTPCGLGILPDGRLVVLTMFRRRLLTFANGKLSEYADLRHMAAGALDDMIVDRLGRAYVGDLGFDLPPPPNRGSVGRIILVMPDGGYAWSPTDCAFRMESRFQPIRPGSSSRKWMVNVLPSTT